ncbi:MAG: hypothetical protein ACE5IY_05380 [bacterium]
MKKKRLAEEIKEFQQNKKMLIPILVVLGVLGLILPILPGIAFLFLAYVLVFPRQGQQAIVRIRKYLKNWF